MKKFLSVRWMMVVLTALLAVGLSAFAAGCGDDEDPTTSASAPAAPATPATTGGEPTATEEPSGEEKTVKIVSDLPLQGASATQTRQMVKGIELYMAEIQNKAGSYTVEYESKDDSTAAAGKWDPEKCASNAEEYLADESIVGVVGTFNSGCAQIVIPKLNEGPVAMVSPANTLIGLTKGGAGAEPDEPDKYYPSGTRTYGRVVASDDFQGAAAAQLMQELGVKSVYVMHDNEAYGKGLGTAFQAAAEGIGLEVRGFEPYDPKASDYTATFNRVKGVDAVFIGAIIDNNGEKIVNDKVAVLGDNETVKLFGPDGMFVNDILEVKNAEGMYLSVAGGQLKDITGRGKELLDKVKAETGQEPEVYTAYAMAATQLLLEAIENSDGTREDVAAKLFEVAVPPEESATGRELKLDENGDIAGAKDISFSQVKGGEFESIKTISPEA